MLIVHLVLARAVLIVMVSVKVMDLIQVDIVLRFLTVITLLGVVYGNRVLLSLYNLQLNVLLLPPSAVNLPIVLVVLDKLMSQDGVFGVIMVELVIVIHLVLVPLS